MYVDRRVWLSNKLWARHRAPTHDLARWLCCERDPFDAKRQLQTIWMIAGRTPRDGISLGRAIRSDVADEFRIRMSTCKPVLPRPFATTRIVGSWPATRFSCLDLGYLTGRKRCTRSPFEPRRYRYCL